MDEKEKRLYIVNLAKKFIGTPYIWGGSNPNVGFDCSGFVIWVCQVFDVLSGGDWTADELLHMTKVCGEFVEPGDLCFYGKKGSGKTDEPAFDFASHVGFYDGQGNCISASGGGSDCLTLEDARKKNAMVKIKPVHYRSDFLGYGRLL